MKHQQLLHLHRYRFIHNHHNRIIAIDRPIPGEKEPAWPASAFMRATG
jgi:hypothetical protein